MGDGEQVLDGLLEVFPLVNLSTLIEAATQFKDDVDAAADYVIQNVLPNTVPHPSQPNKDEDLYTRGLQQTLNDTSTHLGLDSVDNSSDPNPVQFYLPDKVIVKQLKQSATGSCSDVPSTSGQDCCSNVPSTSGQDCISEEISSDSLMPVPQTQHSFERDNEISDSGGDMSLHDDGSPNITMRSSYSVNLKSLDDIIADEQYKKVTLLSNAAAISEMLQEVELNEEKTKHAISEASQAGNDILLKVEELKEVTTLAVEDNKKVAGEIFAEKSILATEAHELQNRLFNISEETKNFLLTIDEMHHTLQRRLAASEVEREAAEKEKLEREALAQKSLKEHELSLEAAKRETERLEQQSQENAKLKELLMDQGHVVDALHGEMLGIFDSITQLKLRVDMQLPVDEPRQQVSSSLSCSAVDEPLQRVSSCLSSSAVYVQPQPVSSTLSSSVKSASSKSSYVKSLASKSSWSSAAVLNVSLKDDVKIADLSDGNSASDDSWDVVDDEDEVSSPTGPLYATPMLI